MSEINYDVEARPAVRDARAAYDEAAAELNALKAQLADAEDLRRRLEGRLEETWRLSEHGAATDDDLKTVERQLKSMRASVNRLAKDVASKEKTTARLGRRLEEARTKALAGLRREVDALARAELERLFGLLSEAVRVNLRIQELRTEIQGAGLKGLDIFPEPMPQLLPAAMQPGGGYEIQSAVTVYRRILRDRGTFPGDLLEQLYDASEITREEAVYGADRRRRAAAQQAEAA